MKLVIPPGNHYRNKEWAEAAAKAAAGDFTDVYTHHYHHWETDKEIIDFDLELERLAKVIRPDKPYAVLAKSAGAVLCIYGNFLNRLNPVRCLFMGLPLGWSAVRLAQLEKWLPRISIPTTIIQNSNDPYAACAQVKNFLAKFNLPNLTLLETPGVNHDYLDFKLIKTKAPDFFKN